MTYDEKRKAKAALKIGFGIGRCVSGVLLTFGHGLLSIAIRAPGARCSIGHAMIRTGEQTARDGMAEWKK